jgi:hypothetical protein
MGFWDNVGSGFKNIFSGVKNVVKSAFSPKNWWKTLIIGTSIVLGGAALGYWDTGFKQLDGAFKGGKSDSNWFSSALGSEGWLGKNLGRDTASQVSEYTRRNADGTAVYPEDLKSARENFYTQPESDAYKTGIDGVVDPSLTEAAVKYDLANNDRNIFDSLARGASRASTEMGDVWDAGANTRLGSSIGQGFDSVAKKADKNPTLGLIAAQGVVGAMDDPVQDQVDLKTALRAEDEKTRNAFEVPDLRGKFASRSRGNLSGSAKILNKAELEKELNRPLTTAEWDQYVLSRGMASARPSNSGFLRG